MSVKTTCLGVLSGLLFSASGIAEAATPCPVADVAQDLASTNPSIRLKAARVLREAACYGAALPLAALVADPVDEVQLEAIAGEVAIFLNKNVVARRHVGFVIEVRHDVASDAFWAGPMASSGRPAPAEVLAALRAAAHDDNPRVAVEALYAFGAMAAEVKGVARRDLQEANGPYLADLAGSAQREMRLAAVAVIGRIYTRWPDETLNESVGPAVIAALDDREDVIKIVAARAIGGMRYERALQPLTDLFSARARGDVAEAALDALARIAHPSSMPLFKSLLTATDTGLKTLAIAGLARGGDRRVIAEIDDSLMYERSDDVILSRNFASVLLENASIDMLGEGLLQASRHDIALAYLIEVASTRPAKFLAYALDPDPRLRADVADILGLTRDPRGLPLVEPMLKDRDPRVAQAAERAVARMRP
ncbi:MAG: HEAT repeat domain-containing protein [Acidobacteria bacterium]|nr:HEAT repeat domain-containing protein [Acidobacteriota bacterium]